MKKSSVEQVLVVPRRKLFDGRPMPYGFKNNDLPNVVQHIYTHAYFIVRPEAEKDSFLKQIIPYVIITCRDDIFLLQRYATQTESRLHDKYSIGVGGHINPIGKPDKVPDKIIEKSLERELQEELLIKKPYQYKLIGYLNDDSNLVGMVHFGVIHRLEIKDKTDVSIAEKDLMSGNFVNINGLKQYYDRMETWSQILVKALFTKI